MSQGIQFIDIIFLGLVAGFLVLRLRSVLGRRTGNERPPADPYAPRPREEARQEERRDDNVIELPGRRIERPDAAAGPQTPLEAGLTQIRLADDNFEPDSFLSGARMAFEMIVEAFAKGDSAALRPLLADDVYRNFDAAIRDRESRGETMETDIAALKGIGIVGAEMRNRVAYVTVRFVTEQTTVVRNAEGAVIEGDPATAEPVVDLWTFARDTSSRDPNWQLVATETPEDEEEAADVGGDRT
ncbi:Tim44/TimA family putative adaptor protein [Novispirillum sp. DQ9]|uniref:Tim44/TimA family putative adaptor protein n=1 Tax=Novispirillum sp. DQ9 TaxID=3398612 RepID=UPI003C7DCDAB